MGKKVPPAAAGTGGAHHPAAAPSARKVTTQVSMDTAAVTKARSKDIKQGESGFYTHVESNFPHEMMIYSRVHEIVLMQ